MDGELAALIKQIEDVSLRDKIQKKVESSNTTKLNVFSSNAKGVDHLHPKGNLHKNETNDITICFEPSIGERPAKILKSALLKQASVVHEASSVSQANLNQIEQILANSRLAIIILSADALFYPFIPFAFETCSVYNVPVMLVHDLESCFFPNYEGQPPYVVKFFSEKAITFLKDYTSTAIDAIMQRYDEVRETHAEEEEAEQSGTYIYSSVHPHKLLEIFAPSGLCDYCSGNIENENVYACPGCNFGVCQACRKKTEISTKTRAFLSHKRTTAQVIAGRLYEGLTKAGFNVFLDSEAKFKLHDLEKIVEQTGKHQSIRLTLPDLLVFILSAGIFESVWCLKEVRSALQYKKPVIVIRDTTFKIPAKFPDEIKDIEELIRKSPVYPWVAEYNTQCVDTIINYHLGAPDEVLEALPQWWDSHAAEVESGVLNVTDAEWKHKLVYLISGLRISLKVDMSGIHTVQAGNGAFMNATSFGLDQLPNLKKLIILNEKNGASLANGTVEFSSITSKAAKVIVREAPQLEQFLLDCQNTDSTLVAFFRGLTNLKIIHCAQSRFSNEVCEIMAAYLKKLEGISARECWLPGLEALRPIGQQIKEIKFEQCEYFEWDQVNDLFPNAVVGSS